MQTPESSTRQSVSLPLGVSRRVRALARSKGLSSSRMIADLVSAGLAAKEREKERFFELADQLSRSERPAEQRRLKAELARLTFGG